MGTGAYGYALRNRFFYLEELQHTLGNHIAQHSCNDYNHHCQRHISPKLRSHVHADCRGDGLGQECDISLMVKAEQLREQQYAHKAGDYPRNDARHHGLPMLLQQLELLIQGHGKTYGRRSQQEAYGI